MNFKVKDVVYKYYAGEIPVEYFKGLRSYRLAENIIRSSCFLRDKRAARLILGHCRERRNGLTLAVYKFPKVDIKRSKNCLWCDWKQGEKTKSLKKHIISTHEEVSKDFYAAKTQLRLYQELVKYVRNGYWWSLALMVGGCRLCLDPEKLADGTPNSFPYRCSRFDTSKNRCWDILDFGIALDHILKDDELKEWWRYGFILF